MKKILSILFLEVFVFCLVANADVLPKDKSILHMCRVYFEDKKNEKAAIYQLRIFADSSKSKTDTALITKTYALPAFVCDGFKWGATYHWQINALSAKGKLLQKGILHTFSIVEELGSPYFDSIKIDVLRNKPSLHANGFLVIDYLRGIYDRSGKLVWKLPSVNNLVDASSEIRDLKFTKDNTLTFLSSSIPLEIDLSGKVVWQLPSPFVFNGDTIAFHHDFQKTKHNTYLMLGNKSVYRKVINGDIEKLKQSEREIVIRNGELFARTDVAIILELSSKGEVLWWWDSNSYLKDEDLNFKLGPGGFPQMQTHANAIGINDENTSVFIGFRDLSRLLIIDKATKTIQLAYGQKYPSGEAKWGNDLFKQQHDAKPTTRNSFFIFNNNGPKGNFGISSILELSTDSNKRANPVLWSFTLDFDTLTKGRSGSGGNVNELDNGNILLCAGQLNRIFEVSKNKEVVWDALIYALQKSDLKWHAMPNYRASWVKDIVSEPLYTDLKVKKKNSGTKLDMEIIIYNPTRPNDLYEILTTDASTGRELTRSLEFQSNAAGFKAKIQLKTEPGQVINLQIRSKTEIRIVKNLTFN